MVAHKRESAAVADIIIDAFEAMLAESAARPLLMGVALHAYLMGQPYRLKHLAHVLRRIKGASDDRVWFTTAGAINDHIRSIGA